MKILFVISQFYKGGAEVALLNLLNLLDKDKYDVDLVILNQSAGSVSISLVDRVPSHVTVFDAFQEEKKLSPFARKWASVTISDVDRQVAPVSALMWIRNRRYDWAFHYGEWSSPAFVAHYVQAKRKCAWIHTDIAEAKSFDADEFFSHDNAFDKYIFVSRHSLRSSVKAFPFLAERSECVLNICDVNDIRRRAEESLGEDAGYFERGLPVIVTCANIRPEKNHERQLEAMALLKKRGLNFIWLNLGSLAEAQHCEDLRRRAMALGLGDRFVLAGPRTNPYKYMKRADAVAVLSNYESWSIVITEAKILGKPIVATKTSGALEQIEHEKTGLLTDFTVESIADEMEKMLSSAKLRDKFRRNLQYFDNTPEILGSFDRLVEDGLKLERWDSEERKKNENRALLIVDDINYMGGAHAAARQMVSSMSSTPVQLDVFSLSAANVKQRCIMPRTRFYSWEAIPENNLFRKRLLECLLDGGLPVNRKLKKLRMTYYGKRPKTADGAFNQFVMPGITRFFSSYRTICVLSEGSALKQYAAACSSPKKIQWIHTDYCAWCEASDFTREQSKNDRAYWKTFSRIVLLSEHIRAKMAVKFPEYADKLCVVSNFFDVEATREKAEKGGKVFPSVSITSLCSMDQREALPRLFRILKKLDEEGYSFKWLFVGDELGPCKKMASEEGLDRHLAFVGKNANPYALIRRSDVYAALPSKDSAFEIIHEAFAMGTPVLATDEGDVREQITEHVNGWIASNDEPGIYGALCHIMEHPDEVERAKHMLTRYRDDAIGYITVLSQEVSDRIAAQFPEYRDKLRVVPAFVDGRTIQEKARRLRKDFPSVSFVTVCRFEHVKAIPRLLEVLKQLRGDGYDFNWTFIGNGEEWAACRKTVAESTLRSCVSFTGAMSNPFPLMRKADVFGLFSYYEGLPNTIFEALALGLPVCVTDIGGVRDQIRDGVTGWIAENSDEGIYETLRYVLEHPEEVRQAKERLKDYRYDNEAVKQKTLSVFE